MRHHRFLSHLSRIILITVCTPLATLIATSQPPNNFTFYKHPVCSPGVYPSFFSLTYDTNTNTQEHENTQRDTSSNGGSTVIEAVRRTAGPQIADQVHNTNHPINNRENYQGNRDSSADQADKRAGSQNTGAYTEKKRSFPFTVTGHYHKSTNTKEFGYYFGYFDGTKVKNSIGVGAADADLQYPQDIIHDATNYLTYDSSGDIIKIDGIPVPGFIDPKINPLHEIISFNPYYEEYGLSVHTQTEIAPGIMLAVCIPFQQLTHHLGMVRTGTITQNLEHDRSGTAVTLLDYLQGNVEQFIDPNKQDALKYGKFKEKQTVSGPADIHVELTGELSQSENTRVNLHGTIIMPTTSGPTGEFLFEPVLGTGGHWFIGIGASVTAELTGMVQSGTLQCSGMLNHYVGIANSEIRTPNYIRPTGAVSERGRYFLIGKHGNNQLRPYMNVFTKPMNVTPGQTTDLLLSAQYKNDQYQITGGYRLQHTTAETVTQITSIPTNTFGVSSYDFKTGGIPTPSGVTPAFTEPELNGVPDSVHGITYESFDVPKTVFGGVIFSDDLMLLSSAGTPKQVTHSLFADLTLRPFTSKKTAVTARGSYSFSGGSATFGIEGWSVGCTLAHQF